MEWAIYGRSYKQLPRLQAHALQTGVLWARLLFALDKFKKVSASWAEWESEKKDREKVIPAPDLG